MGKLIDAELASKNIGRHRVLGLEKGDKEMNEAMGGYNPSSFIAGFDYGMELALKVVHNQPTVDAVEVVRCKDCKHYGGRYASNECSLITKLGNPDYWLKTLPTDFCSSGEKMDGGDK